MEPKETAYSYHSSHPSRVDTLGGDLEASDQQELTSKEVHILETLDTVAVIHTARERLDQLDDYLYREEYGQKWKTTIKEKITELENQIAKEQNYLDNPSRNLDLSVRLPVEKKIIYLKGKLTYLERRLENADSEINTELETAREQARRTIQDLAWALEKLYDIDEAKCEATSPEELGKSFTLHSAWAAETQRTISMEQEIIRHRHEANAILTIPEFPQVGLSRLKEVITSISLGVAQFTTEYKTAQTREDWQAILDTAVESGLKEARNNTRRNIKGDAKYVVRDL